MRASLTSLLAALLLSPSAPALAAAPFAERAEVRAWVDRIVARHALERAALLQLIAGAEHRPEVIAHARKPAEALPWHRYRAIFLTAERAQAGRVWLRDHAALLSQAERRYGVPPEIIAAIVGVESNYGANTGRHPVLDSLLTLGFDYPPRATFFREQLETLLVLGARHELDVAGLRGSWAGALGQSQFIPTSYRDFAVDGNADGRADLWDSPADIIFSIANYFRQHHWRRGGPIAERIAACAPGLPVSQQLKPDIAPAQLRSAGVALQPMPAEPVSVHSFETGAAPECWIGHHNFYVITRYNHSALYALAVHQLADRLRGHG